MMGHAKKTVFIMSVVLCFTSSVALRCYQCVSNREGNCDNEGQMQTKNCDSSAEATSFLFVQPVCIKVVRDIKGVDLITRSCGFEGSLLHPCDSHESADHCSTCSFDLCNGSTKITVNYPLILTVLICYFRRLLLVS